MNRQPDEEVNQIISLVRMCQTLNVLPQAGGLLDQDAYFIYLLQQVLLADQERQALDKARQKAA
jgi:hypothetical protein